MKHNTEHLSKPQKLTTGNKCTQRTGLGDRFIQVGSVLYIARIAGYKAISG